MNTARQAMENMEYVRMLLEEKQPGFAAYVELAVFFIHVRSSGRRKTMELTLPPGHHKTIEKQDPVHEWRVARLARLGLPWTVAEAARPCRLAPDGGAGAAGLPSGARTPHPPLRQVGN